MTHEATGIKYRLINSPVLYHIILFVGYRINADWLGEFLELNTVAWINVEWMYHTLYLKFRSGKVNLFLTPAIRIDSVSLYVTKWSDDPRLIQYHS